ncbi:TPA: AAA family ATPase [Streptococcus suis]|nr:AAA family ATPase [Streptococcus suis]
MAAQKGIREYIDSKLGLTMNKQDNYTDIIVFEGEEIVVSYLPIAVTGTNRPKPQLRIILDNASSGYNLAKKESLRNFILTYYDGNPNNISRFKYYKQNEWFLSIEIFDAKSNKGRLDIQSMFEHLDKVLSTNPNENFVRCTPNEHSSGSNLYGTFIRVFDSSGAPTQENLETYIKLIDYRPSFLVRKKSKCQIDLSKFNCKLRNSVKQEIHFGAPGTGKSYGIAKIIKKSYPNYSEKDDHPLVLRTTIHSEYSYYDFIGSILPDSREGEITYKFSPGIFTKALSRAIKYPDHDVFLIIEEMSRGNIAAIFGDTFQLLDRGEDGTSDYQIDNALISDFLRDEGLLRAVGDKVAIPGNLHIIGTVNTSDQNVNVIDTAFKRRFNFVYKSVKPERDKYGKLLNSFNFKIGTEIFEWNCFYTALNNFIVDKLELSDDKQIGQFFVKVNSGTNAFSIVKNKVLHYLWDDVQEASLKNIKLFNESVKSFTQLFDRFTETAKLEDIFSQLFIDTYNEAKKVFESDTLLVDSGSSTQGLSQTSSDSESTSTSESSSENFN